MAPAPKANASPLETDIKYILSAIASCPDFAPTWKTVATEHKIAYDRNASTKFRTTVKKYGYQFSNAKLVRLTESEKGENGVQAAPETRQPSTKIDDPEGSAKKRKAGGEEGPVKKIKEIKVDPEGHGGG